MSCFRVGHCWREQPLRVQQPEGHQRARTVLARLRALCAEGERVSAARLVGGGGHAVRCRLAAGCVGAQATQLALHAVWLGACGSSLQAGRRLSVLCVRAGCALGAVLRTGIALLRQ